MIPDGNIRATIDGDIKGQVAVGNYILQIGDVNGGVVNVASQSQGPNYTRRTTSANLRPRPFPALLDRDDETASVISALSASMPVSLFGPAGIGKTSLLRNLAHLPETSSFPDGVVYLSVAGLGLEDVLQSLFDVFHESQSNFKPTDTEIRIALRGVKALILLDDLALNRDESLAMLDAAPNCTFVLASLERSLWGEGKILSLVGLPIEAALDLFVLELNRSLNEREQVEVREICALLGGHPLRILQSAALVREKSTAISDVKARLQGGAPDNVVVRSSLESSTDSQKSIMAILTAAGGVAVPVNHLEALAQSADLKSDLQRLVSLGLVWKQDSKFSLAGDLSATLIKLWDLTAWEDRLIEFLVDWLVKKPAKSLLDDSVDVLLYSIQKAEKKGRWRDVVQLGRGLERILIFWRRWQAWLDILNLILKAARALGDRKMEGWALHQIGTRAACLGINESARGFLTQALQIRQAIGDQAGLAITQNNLHVFFNIPLPPQAGQPGCRRCLTCGAVGAGVAAIATVVIAGAFLLFNPTPVPMPSPTIVAEVFESETPTSIPATRTPTLTKTNAPTRTPTFTWTPTKTPTPTRTPTRTPSPTNTLNSPPPAPEIVYPTESDTVICPSGSEQIIMDWNEPFDPSGIDHYEVSLAVEFQPGSWQLLINHQRVNATQLNVTDRIAGRCGETFEFYVRAWDRGGALGESSSVEFFVFFPGPD